MKTFSEFLNEEVEKLGEKCWDGYKQEGMKKKGKKIVPNCVPESEEDDKKEDGLNKKDKVIVNPEL